MKSEVFMLNSDAGRMAAARYVTEEFARGLGLDKHESLRLELLTEETLGMVKALVDDFYGQIWFEGEGKRCEIHLQATADMNTDRREELLSISSSGRNAAAKGFMAMLKDVVSGAMHSFGRSMNDYGREVARYGIVNPADVGGFAVDAMVPIWSLQTYRTGLETQRLDNAEADAAWDELEKSIVGKLADDVVVGVKGDRIEIVITKDFAR
ncbi:MAG: hypothetical protein IKF98_07790 [Clostridia bacterium]|nr:hypothetical protein [Clostridia bacterium]MBR3273806.1 hypothetical protein [Clostridia bacterium]